jgi:hypothetical protein
MALFPQNCETYFSLVMYFSVKVPLLVTFPSAMFWMLPLPYMSHLK